jgi:hypothetical protein
MERCRKIELGTRECQKAEKNEAHSNRERLREKENHGGEEGREK